MTGLGTESTITLETERLLLRRFELSDSSALRTLLSDPRVNATTTDTPDPNDPEALELWIARGHEGILWGFLYPFAIVLKSDKALLGYVDIEVSYEHRHGDLAYWLGRPYWGNGYATEAARRVLHFGFEQLNLNRIYATCFAHNHPSIRVMQRLGMQHEATLRQHALKDGTFYDVVYFGVLRSEWKK